MIRSGYFYDKDGYYTHTDTLPNKPVYEKQTMYRWESKEVVTDEKLCEVHLENAEGKQDCPNCVMYKVEHEDVRVPYEENVYVGEEPDVPANCTLEAPPELVYEPVFRDGKWVKTKDYTPPVEPSKPPVSSEVEELRKQLNNVKKVLDEILIGGAM